MCFIKGIQVIWLIAIVIFLGVYLITEPGIAILAVPAVVVFLVVRSYIRRKTIAMLRGEHDHERI